MLFSAPESDSKDNCLLKQITNIKRLYISEKLTRNIVFGERLILLMQMPTRSIIIVGIIVFYPK